MSKHVLEGADAEKKFVHEMNKNKNDSRWKSLGFDDSINNYAIRVSSTKFSKIHNKKIPCKSDVFIAKSEKPVDKFDLTENDLETFGLEQIKETGISIKKENAKNIQWQKLGIGAVKELFRNTELGAGISLYEREGSNHNNLLESLNKNKIIVEKWCDSIKVFEVFFKEVPDIQKLLDETESDDVRQEIAKKVGKVADTKMKNMINDDEKLQKKIFWGIGVFEDPFCASWVFEDGDVKKTEGYFPKFSITTGNSRTKNFTIAIKGSK
jgi:hypothetical protein